MASESRVQNYICGPCLALDPRKPFYGPEYITFGSTFATRVVLEHHSSVQVLKNSIANDNCHLCFLILDAIHKYNDRDEKEVVDDWEHADLFLEESDEENELQIPHDIKQKHEAFFFDASASLDEIEDPASPILLDFALRDLLRDELQTRCIDVSIYWTHSDGVTRSKVTAFSLVYGLPNKLVELCEKRDLNHDNTTASLYSEYLSRSWLRSCDENHTMCHARRNHQPLTLPTRLIDVGSRNHDPFLYQSRPGQSADYICLSHCWGSSQPFKTTNDTLANHSKGLSVSKMPKTFRDAIQITRNLNMKYLWIDSLCIIQDSAEDWARESAQMRRIYRDASVTIFAEFAASDDEGCFMSRNGKATALCRTPMFDELVELFRPGGSPSFVQAKLHHGASSSMPSSHHVFETVRSLDPRSSKPLNTRGWVLQETILSFRSLIYDQFEVRWSCPSMKACECVPEGFTRQSWLRSDQTQNTVSTINAHAEDQRASQRELFNSWSYVVSEYTKRKLTFSKDKLPALAGMAAEMTAQYAKASDRESTLYIAGLWSHTLRANLAWFIHSKSTNAPYRETSRPHPYRAPSWSWASIEGQVTPVFDFDISVSTSPRQVLELLCEILSCHAEPLSLLNPYGEVTAAKLILRGRMGKAKCGIPVTNTFHVDRVPLFAHIVGEEELVEVGWFDADVTPSTKREKIEDVYCMPLFCSLSEMKFLALCPVTTKSNSNSWPASSQTNEIYQRIGLVSPKGQISYDQKTTQTERNTRVTFDIENSTHRYSMVHWIETYKIQTITVV